MIAVMICLLICGSCLKAQTFLHANGSKIVDAGNKEVFLHGMGLGGWLLMEGYMLQTNGNYGQGQIKRDMYLNGATENEIDTFFSQWRNNHTTAADISYLKSLDLNCLRLPMHYELFLTTAQRKIRNAVIYNKIPVTVYIDSLEKWYDQDLLFTETASDGYAAVDKTLDWAGSNGMWVVLDLHSAPGGQGTQTSISDALVTEDLWNRTDSKVRKIYQLITIRLWKAISTRYKADGRIAMYDLINEPNTYVQNSNIKTLFENLINAIRTNGDNHLLLLEGNGYGNEYNGITPDFFPNQQNLVWSSHRYWAVNDPAVPGLYPNEFHTIADLVNFRLKWNVPVWVGEMGENSNHWIAQACRNLNDNNLGWSLWTLKRLGGSGVPLFEFPVLMKVSYANVNTASGRTDILKNILYENCFKQKDYEYSMTKAIGDGATLPYHGLPAPIPGKVFASDYDLGRNGVAYSDSIYEMDVYNGPYYNSGYMYRNDGVDMSLGGDTAGNGLEVGWIERNDWMNYTIGAAQSANYTVQLRVANGENHNGAFVIKADGRIVDTVSIPATGSDQKWTTVTLHNPVRLSAGTHVIQVLAAVSGGRFSYITFTQNNAGSAAASQLVLVPNPVSKKLRIFNIQANATVNVLDVSGRQLMTFTVPDENYELDVSNLSQGSYVLNISEGTKTESRIMIKK